MTIERHREFVGRFLRIRTMKPGDIYSVNNRFGSFNELSKSCNIEVLTPDIIRVNTSGRRNYNFFGFIRTKPLRQKDRILFGEVINNKDFKFTRFSGLVKDTIIWKPSK